MAFLSRRLLREISLRMEEPEGTYGKLGPDEDHDAVDSRSADSSQSLDTLNDPDHFLSPVGRFHSGVLPEPLRLLVLPFLTTESGTKN
jgi:hypothetical protein